MTKTSYKIKSLAQRLPKQGTIAPGIYELEDLGQEVIDYQKKLKNLIEIHTEEKVESTFDLKLKVEDSETKTPIKRNRKTRRNINDDSN